MTTSLQSVVCNLKVNKKTIYLVHGYCQLKTCNIPLIIKRMIIAFYRTMDYWIPHLFTSITMNNQLTIFGNGPSDGWGFGQLKVQPQKNTYYEWQFKINKFSPPPYNRQGHIGICDISKNYYWSITNSGQALYENYTITPATYEYTKCICKWGEGDRISIILMGYDIYFQLNQSDKKLFTTIKSQKVKAFHIYAWFPQNGMITLLNFISG